jgi:hypothetical protein
MYAADHDILYAEALVAERYTRTSLELEKKACELSVFQIQI